MTLPAASAAAPLVPPGGFRTAASKRWFRTRWHRSVCLVWAGRTSHGRPWGIAVRAATRVPKRPWLDRSWRRFRQWIGKTWRSAFASVAVVWGAACTTVGVLRALELLGLAQHVTKLSVVAGSAWASCAYVFGQASGLHLLGSLTRPGSLTLEALDALSVPLLQSATRNRSQAPRKTTSARNGAAVEELLLPLVRSQWLEPFNLDQKHFIAGSEQEKKQIIQQYPKMKAEAFACPRSDRPSWLVGGTLLSEGEQLPFQMSASSISGPSSPQRDRAYEPILFPFVRELETETLQMLGSVPTFAFGGVQHVNRISQTAPVLVAPAEPFTLADMLTLSGLSRAAKLLDSPLTRWPVKAAGSQEPQAAFADGACTDNSGLLALLQRRVQRIVWVDFGWEAASAGSPQANNMNDLMEKFGLLQAGSSPFAKHTQVFGENEVAALLHQLQVRRNAGEPGVVRRTLRVVRNETWQIPGGFSVDLVLIHIDRVDNFEKSLPEDTYEELKKGFSGCFTSFPFLRPKISSVEQGSAAFSVRQANLLAALAEREYHVRYASSLLRSLIPNKGRIPVQPQPMLERSGNSRPLLSSGLNSDIHKV
ncbi:unnamed protein product [Durusdinium trenchii]|uniref:PNPLA domain-containing protein n=1 Tax=Durusdinium trenchii TaxID=1381693 RepID=A0ABP0SYU8_9DINO